MPISSPRPHRLGLIAVSFFCVIAFACALFAPCVQAAPQPVAIAVGQNNLTQILWNNPDGTVGLWQLADDGSVASQIAYGPYTGYSGQALVSGTDSYPRILWKHAPDGQLSLWDNVPGASFYSHTEFGPYTGYTAQSLAIGWDNNVRLLWAKSDGTLSLWRNIPGGNIPGIGGAGYTDFSHAEYGPFAGYQPALLGVGTNTIPHILWNHNDGAISLWNDVQGTSDFSHAEYGPYTGYAPIALAVDSTGAPRVLWTGPNNTVSLWKVAANGTYTHAEYTDPLGYLPVGMACGTGGDVRLLWSNGQGNAKVWVVSSTGYVTENLYSSLFTFAVSGPSVSSGSSVTGTVTLANPAPAGGVSVILSSTQTAAKVPTSVFIPATQTKATFTINTGPTSATVTAGIKVAYSGTILTASLTILSAPVSAQPLTLTATPGNITVSLSWAGGAGGDSYNLYRGTSSGGEGLLPYKSGLNINPYVDTSLTNGTIYYYQISAVNSGSESALSAEISATPQTAPLPPPSHLTPGYAIFVAQRFCDSIKAGVTATAVATWPAPSLTPSQQPYHWQPRWLITFGNQATVEVVDATGVVSRFYNYALSQQLLNQNSPAGVTMAESTALERAATAMQASYQPATELAAIPTDQHFQITSPPTRAGNLWMVTWPRQFGGVPYRQEQATVMLQAETGAVQAFSLSFPAAPPAAGVGSVTSAQATQTAQTLMTSANAPGIALQNTALQVVQPTTYWQDGSTTPVSNGVGRVAWNCLFTDANSIIYEVWVDGSTGAVIGGESYGIAGMKARPMIKNHANIHRQAQKVIKVKK